MRRNLLLVSFVFFVLLAVDALAQPPALSDNALTKWVVDEPKEIASYLIFDPATVKDRLPSSLRFITIGELAAIGIPWAKDRLNEYPTNADWGISFIEIVRMKTFEIDGRSPECLSMEPRHYGLLALHRQNRRTNWVQEGHF